VGDREILETYSNSASKNTPETVTFPHGTKPLLTSVINRIYEGESSENLKSAINNIYIYI